VNKCPVCRGNCNCKSCLRGDISRVNSKSGKKSKKTKKSDATKIDNSKAGKKRQVIKVSMFLASFSSSPSLTVFYSVRSFFTYRRLVHF
jgi:hypothetical protein